MKSLEELRELRSKVQKDLEMRSNSERPKIIIGMGTCGIAAGARKILKAVMKEIDKRGLDVIVTQTGCIGMCEKEPLLDVKMPGKDRVTYGNLTPADVKMIIVEHVINGNVVEDLAIARFDEGGN
ncbi:(2Fe-2S) ferredoxin domain-containing protein [Iocasia frigidifontis]|uniref:(2Fe-2S) ferredoxin domain-containing protein n=1 Tax=Iocasia fonsfrigidae TaxID=2682810 RepID=A0A8A7KNM1_9FIRM|nr:(2Fe-2S) ferredoxin domain-containing protein [Iocasia fonsfrigidae]QTL99644.1 (2Fe-2S) ferredoxin domain-containing protein [Iocasia fonsfrigidae]